METTTKPKLTVEQARKAYHDATVEMATIDAKLIDAAATLEELKTAHGKAIIRVNETREGLVEARTPSAADVAAVEREIFDDKSEAAAKPADPLGLNGAVEHAVPGMF